MPAYFLSVGKCLELKFYLDFTVRAHCLVPTEKMEGEENADSGHFSDDEIYNNLADDFDLFDLTEKERAELANAITEYDGNTGDELDDENLPLSYNRPRFDWTGGDFAEPCTPRKNFERCPSPVRIFDMLMKAVDYFQLFYSDTVLSKLVSFANDNASRLIQKKTVAGVGKDHTCVVCHATQTI